MASSKSGHPESNQGPSDLCKRYTQMLCQLSYSRLDTNHRIPSTYTEHAAWRANLLASTTRKKPVTLLCVSSLWGHGNLEKKAVTLLCVSSLREHGNLARRIKLTRVTKENLRLKILEVKGHLVLGTPAIVLGGPHLASPAPPRTSQWQKPSCSHLGSITWTVWPSGLRRWLKAPFRKGVGSNPTAVIPTHQTDRCRWSQAWTFFPDTPPFFSCCFWTCLRSHHQAETMSGVAQWFACWAHNPKVPGSKPGCAMVWHDLLSCIFRSASVSHHTKGCSGTWTQALSHPERESCH